MPPQGLRLKWRGRGEPVTVSLKRNGKFMNHEIEKQPNDKGIHLWGVPQKVGVGRDVVPERVSDFTSIFTSSSSSSLLFKFVRM